MNYFIKLPEGHDKKVFNQCMSILEKISGCRPLNGHHKEATYLVSDDSHIYWGDSMLGRYEGKPHLYTELYLYGENV